MHLVKNRSLDPTFNLALDEYLLSGCTGEYFMLWQNEPSVIIGRNQDALKEINLHFLKEHNIHLVRRMSGGGAVFHDLGNINFTYITSCQKADFFNFERFSAPVIAALKALGINAEMSGRNDLTIDGRKFSGNAQHMSGGRILHHGTLLFSSDFSYMEGALQVDPRKLSGKGVQSVRSRVVNIRDCLSGERDMDAQAFLRYMEDFVLRYFDDVQPMQLSPSDVQAVNAISDKKYRTEQWNLRHMPDYALKKSIRFPSGLVDTAVEVKGGVIADVRFFGDFFGALDIFALQERLTGVTHGPDAVLAALSDIALSDYISGLKNEDILALLF